ncbi:glycoside hydrolase family 19 protein [Microbulbifer agarilyticus]|uniref:glycoside hydrolase family 19 protein n=1 Tax=Microbulbifer agarilyticus TaxID=260552 RepID=UPI001CD679F4|nr:glycoside hydrolase family 19 protein [Microbulbifer agarilyticus]MCA0894481.1 hypothetical protein [Microbulbifer agarilyticus]
MTTFDTSRWTPCCALFLAGTLSCVTQVTAASAPTYDSTQSYAGGSEVCYQSDLFRAQWWAGPGQSPEAVYTATNSWDSPWLLETEGGCTDINPNATPVAVASVSLSEITGAGSVVLDAAGSYDADGDTLSFAWSQISPAAPLASITSPQSAATEVQLAAVATDTTYRFRVTVSDGSLTATDSISLLQRADTPQGNAAPVARAEVDQSQVSCPAMVLLDGSNSSDSDLDTLSFQWRQTAGATAQISSPNDPTTQVTLPSSAGNFSFELTVSDGALQDSDATTISQQCGGSGYPISLSALKQKEAELTSSDLFRAVKETITTRSNTVVEQVAPGLNSNPANVRRAEAIVSNQKWDFLFPVRAPEYSYTNLLRAIAKFPAFCGDYTDGRDADAICQKSLATMFAHFTQETGGHTSHWVEPEWRQGLYFLREQGWTESAANGYGICDPSTWQAQQWPCATFADGSYKSYFGRGAKQLSYNYNYGPFSAAMFGDVNVLLESPELVADTWLNLASAVFFFVYPQPPKPSMLHVIDGTWQPNGQDLTSGLVPGFGVTTMIINGGIECGGSVEHAQSQNRIDYYRHFAEYLAVPISADEVLGCASMDRFAVGGAGAMEIYWEQDWSWDPSYPNGESYACKLVGYQTRFSAFIEGDYVRCVDHFFDVNIDYNN